MKDDLTPRGNETYLSFDELAFYRTYFVIKEFVKDDQEVTDIMNKILNSGVVFRMSQWFIDNYGTEKKTELTEIERMEDEGGPASSNETCST